MTCAHSMEWSCTHTLSLEIPEIGLLLGIPMFFKQTLSFPEFSGIAPERAPGIQSLGVRRKDEVDM